jgi:hypothetical protein
MCTKHEHSYPDQVFIKRKLDEVAKKSPQQQLKVTRQ